MTTREIVSAIGKAVLKPLVQPRGTKLQICEAYFERFSDQQINLFLEKLKKSEWVNNGSFSLDDLVKRDLVNVMLSGSRKVLNVSKHYNPITIAGPRDSHPITLGSLTTSKTCGECRLPMVLTVSLFEDRASKELLCTACNSKMYQDVITKTSAIVSKRMQEGGVPKRYIDSYLRAQDAPNDTLIKNKMAPNGVYLFGESDTGKSHALAGWMRMMLSFGHKCIWLNWPDECCKLHTDQKYFTELVGKISGKVVFIDDFDTTDKFLTVYIYNLVDMFYRDNTPVFYTSSALPDNDKLAMRIGKTTTQIEFVGA